MCYLPKNVVKILCLVKNIVLLYIPWPRTINQLNPDHLSCMWRPEPMLARSHTMPARGSFWPFWSDRRLYKVTMHWLHKFEANPADHQAVITEKPPLGPPGWKREVRSLPPPLSFTLSANHSLPATPMRSKTVADLGSSESFFKEDEAFSAEAASKTLKRLSDVEWEKDSVMWNWVRVKYDSVWPAPTPNIRCLFFVHHIHSPLPTTTTPRHPRFHPLVIP